MTNEERARKWLRDTGHSQFKEHVESLTEMLDDVRTDALREAADVCGRRADDRDALPQGQDWMSVGYTTAANEIRGLAKPGWPTRLMNAKVVVGDAPSPEPVRPLDKETR